MKNKNIVIRVSEGYKKELQILANKHNITLSALVSILIERGKSYF